METTPTSDSKPFAEEVTSFNAFFSKPVAWSFLLYCYAPLLLSV